MPMLLVWLYEVSFRGSDGSISTDLRLIPFFASPLLLRIQMCPQGLVTGQMSLWFAQPSLFVRGLVGGFVRRAMMLVGGGRLG